MPPRTAQETSRRGGRHRGRRGRGASLPDRSAHPGGAGGRRQGPALAPTRSTPDRHQRAAPMPWWSWRPESPATCRSPPWWPPVQPDVRRGAEVAGRGAGGGDVVASGSLTCRPATSSGTQVQRLSSRSSRAQGPGRIRGIDLKTRGVSPEGGYDVALSSFIAPRRRSASRVFVQALPLPAARQPESTLPPCSHDRRKVITDPWTGKAWAGELREGPVDGPSAAQALAESKNTVAGEAAARRRTGPGPRPAARGAFERDPAELHGRAGTERWACSSR